MKKCVECGFENADGMKFCGQCGKALPADVPQNQVCSSCGAKLPPDAVFCGKCGVRLSPQVEVKAEPEKPVQPTHCPSCGAELTPNSSFCLMCGASIDGTSPEQDRPQVVGYAPKTKKPFKLAETKDKVLAFEKKNGVIVNSIVAVLSLVFILVALLCPIKVTMSDIAPTDSNSLKNSGEAMEISQSIFKILSAGSALDLDVNDKSDLNEIQRIYSKYEAATRSALAEFYIWASNNKYVTEEEAMEKLKEIVADHLGDINYYEYVFAYTTRGVVALTEGDAEEEANIRYALNAMRDTAVVSWVFALVVAVMQIIDAAISLVFLILAIVGIVRKKPTKLFLYFTIMLILTGVGLASLMIAPMLSAGGAMFAMSLTAVLTLFVCGTVNAFISGKNAMFVAKRIAMSALSIIALFMLCSNMINVSVIMESTSRTESVISMPLGGAFEQIVSCLEFKAIYGVRIYYSNLSIVTAIITLVLGLSAFVALYTGMALSLKKLAFNAESNSKFDIPMLVGAIMLICLAIVPAIMSAADSYPTPPASGTLMSKAFAQMEISARVFVYLSMAFAVAAFTFGLIFRPNKKTLSPQA
ncbi:MAG: zinc ribbon domain-containing protein [Clostridiales bacterium]|nr:zinc ribbon domain-containing protein [Clostridiales bacterium]